MSVIERFPNAAYGTAIADAVTDMTGKEVSDPQVFVALGRLERQGFIASCPDPNPEPSQRTRGRPRKFYNLTATGKTALEAAGAMITLVRADQRSAKERKNGRPQEGPDFTPMVG